LSLDENGRNKYLVPAVEKAFGVMEFIIKSDTGCTFNEIIDNLKLPKTTAFTVLNSLVACGYIEKTKDKFFIPTIKLFSLGMDVKNFVIKTHTFLASLENLRDATGFTSFLCVYDKGEKVTIEKVDGHGAVLFRAYIGERTNLNTSGAGKAIAAYLNDEELRLVLSKGLKKITDNSIFEEKKFLDHLSLIRRQGYSLDDGEDDISLRCLGMPIFMNGNKLFGSISISTTRENLPMDKLTQYLSVLRTAAEDISCRLGFTGNYGQRLRNR